MHNCLNILDFTTGIIYRSPSLNNKLYIITSGPKVTTLSQCNFLTLLCPVPVKGWAKGNWPLFLSTLKKMNMCINDLSKRALILDLIILTILFSETETLSLWRCYGVFVKKQKKQQWIENKLGNKLYPRNLFIKHFLDCTFPRSSIFNQLIGWLVPWKISLYVCVYNICVMCAFFCFLCVAIVSKVCEHCVHGSIRKAKSLSECRLLRVRRSGSRRRSLGKRAVSSGRWRVISERRARVRPSCSCSTAWMSEMPERSERENGCRSECYS